MTTNVYDNTNLVNAIEVFKKDRNLVTWRLLVKEIQEGILFSPCIIDGEIQNTENGPMIQQGSKIKFITKIMNQNDEPFCPVFLHSSGVKQFFESEKIVAWAIKVQYLEMFCSYEGCAGFVINPKDLNLIIPKEYLPQLTGKEVVWAEFPKDKAEV